MSSTGSGDVFNLTGALLKGTWQVGDFVAQGGFGVVYQGRHVRTHKAVAVKALKLPANLSRAARVPFIAGFQREAQVLGRLQHAAIVEVYDLSEAPDDDGVMWMVLEWVDGERLDHVLTALRAEGTAWQPAQCLDLLRPVFHALAEAHARGIVHRDLKPANLLIAQRAGVRGVPRLLDFGIAKLIDPNADDPPSGDTATGSEFLAFSVHYAAPEQVAQKRTGPWTDVHAMALILTEMLTGQCPYGDRQTDKGHVMWRALNGARPTPAALGVAVGTWEPVLARAMALAPGDRYPTAGEFLRALEEALPGAKGAGGVAATADGKAGPSVPPPVESAASRTAPMRARSRVALALGGVALAGALAGAWALRGRAPEAVRVASVRAEAPRALAAAPVTERPPAPPARPVAPVALAPTGGDGRATDAEVRAAATRGRAARSRDRGRGRAAEPTGEPVATPARAPVVPDGEGL